MRKLLLLGVCLVLLSLGAFAQQRQKGEAYIGFSNFTWGKNGWNGDLGWNFSRTVQAVGDLGGYYSHSNSIHSFMAGVKFESEHRHHGFEPWGRILVGGSHVSRNVGSSATDWSWAIGGGLDSKLSHNCALRISADGFHTDFNGSSDFHLRTGIGLLYRFGR